MALGALVAVDGIRVIAVESHHSAATAGIKYAREVHESPDVIKPAQWRAVKSIKVGFLGLVAQLPSETA